MQRPFWGFKIYFILFVVTFLRVKILVRTLQGLTLVRGGGEGALPYIHVDYILTIGTVKERNM